jgi:hypothetical protein
LPLFDAAFTDAEGIRGRGTLGSDAPVGVSGIAPNAADSRCPSVKQGGRMGVAVIVGTTRGATPGFCPGNADNFLHPFGPPVLHVSSEYCGMLKDGIQKGSEAVLTAHAMRTQSEAFNVTTII